jgi:hypothetical protein
MQGGGGGGAGGGDAADIRGRHRIQAELKKLEQEARFLEVRVCLPSSTPSQPLHVSSISQRAYSSGLLRSRGKNSFFFSILAKHMRKFLCVFTPFRLFLL